MHCYICLFVFVLFFITQKPFWHFHINVSLVFLFSTEAGDYQSDRAADRGHQQWRFWSLYVSAFSVHQIIEITSVHSCSKMVSVPCLWLTEKSVTLDWLLLNLRLWGTWWREQTSTGSILRTVSHHWIVCAKAKYSWVQKVTCCSILLKNSDNISNIAIVSY